MAKEKQNDKVQQEIEVKYEEVRPIPALNIAELEEIDCVKPVGSDTYLLFHCAPKNRYRGACPKCNKRSGFYSNGYAKDRFAHDVSQGLVQIDLTVQNPRYICNICGATFTHPFTSIVQGRQYTTRLYEQIKKRALNERFSSIADEYDISVTTVSDILTEYGEELSAARKVFAPRVLGIDENHLVHEKRGVFVDIERGILLEMTADNKSETMRTTIESFENYAENITHVTLDMYSPYVSVIQECLPNAIMVIDKFHVIQNLYRKIEKTRKLLFAHLKAVIKALPEGEEQKRKSELLTQLGKNVYLFKFGKKKLVEKQERVSLMAEVCSEFSEFNTLWLLKNGIERIYDAETREEAEKRYEEWQKIVPSDEKDKELYAAMHTLRRSMNRWKPYIFNYFDEGCKYTNATTEGLNDFISVLAKTGRGYKFETLRIKALFNRESEDPARYKRKQLPRYDFNKNRRQTADVTMAMVMHKWNNSESQYETEPVQISGGGVVIAKLLKELDKIF